MLADAAPPWTLKFLTANWDAIQRGSMAAWMPQELPGSTPKRRKIDSLGCGRYGCVMLTNTSGLVIKISSDPSEAEFVKAAVKIGEWPVGIVRYQAVLDLPGSHQGRPVFIVWREEAFDVGSIGAGPDPHAKREFEQYHVAYRNAATYVRQVSVKPGWDRRLAEAKAHEEWAWNNVIWEDGKAGAYRDPQGDPRYRVAPFMRYTSARRLAAALRICAITFELMENTNYAHEVGAALGFYLDQGVLLADVHMGNIGHVTRVDPDYGPQTYTVITDPGHAVFLR
jgi:hypothetical protein